MAGRDLVPTVRELVPSRPVLACLGVCALILIAAAIDLVRTESRLPDISPVCERRAPDCLGVERREQLARDRAADPLQDQYDSRAWVYACAILAIAALATAYDMRSRPRTAWPRIFANLGVVGVWLGIASVLLLVATDGSSLAPPPAPTLLLPIALLVAAVAGSLLGRSEGWAVQGQAGGAREMLTQTGRLAVHIGTAGQAKRSRLERLGRSLSSAVVALAGLTSLLAVAALLGKPDCGPGAATPGWADPLDALAAVTAIAGMAAGIGALLLRRWIAALGSLTVCPAALVVVLASTCAFY